MTEKEFYADRLSYRLDRFVRRIIVLLWAFSVIFGIAIWFGHSYEVEPINGFYRYFERYASVYFTPLEDMLVRTSPFWGAALIAVFPGIVKYFRKYWLYPRKHMSRQGFSLIRSKNASTRGTSGREHYVFIDHPVDHRLVPVRVSKQHYFQFLEGDKVAVRYIPGIRDVLSMSAYKVH